MSKVDLGIHRAASLFEGDWKPIVRLKAGEIAVFGWPLPEPTKPGQDTAKASPAIKGDNRTALGVEIDAIAGSKPELADEGGGDPDGEHIAPFVDPRHVVRPSSA
jgi:hypothetical protein